MQRIFSTEYRSRKRERHYTIEYARLLADPDHSEEEDRFILLGLSKTLRLLIVCQCHRESDEVIRIISARKATRKERNEYQGWLK